ncbi:MAG: helix-turn-helix domain-containing protein [Sphaerochaetaceae bacterium]
MQYLREIVHEPEGFDKRHLSSFIIDAPPFANAKIKQGGYGILGTDFWLQRIAKRGFHVLVLTISGRGRFTFEDGTTHIAEPGEAFISWSSGQGHHEQTIGPEPWEMIWLTIWDTTTRFVPDALDWETLRISHPEILKDYFLHIMQEELYLDSKSEEAMELYEQLFLITLERNLGWTEGPELKRKRLALVSLWEIVTKKIDQNWPVETLCEEAHISRSHLSRICTELYHMAPGEKVRELKMTQAKVYLRNSALTIGEVAGSVGYDNIATFSTAFSQFCGCSPRAFRNQKTRKT